MSETIVITKCKGYWSVDRVTAVGTWHIGTSKTRKGAEGWVMRLALLTLYTLPDKTL